MIVFYLSFIAFFIRDSNIVLLGDISDKVEKRLENKQVTDIKNFNNYEDIVILEKNKKINIYEEFKDLIGKRFGPYNDEDITITSDDFTIEKDGYTILNKEGLYLFKINHSFFTNDSINIYAFVDGNSVKYTNIREIKIVNPYFIKSSSVNLKDFLQIERLNEGYEPNLDYILVRNLDTGKIDKIDKTIEVEDGMVMSFEVIDVLNQRKYPIEFKRVGEENSLRNASYKDVKSNHWAFYNIKNLTLKNFINGYPDGTFRPNENISMAEFMTMLSKYIATLPNDSVNPIIGDYPINSISKNSWSYLEVKSVLNRLNMTQVMRINTNDLNRKITRDEVACLISNTIKLDEYKRIPIKKITDLSKSLNPEDIQKLLAIDVLKGYPDNTFRPNNNITRAEIASIFNKLMSKSQGD